MPLAEMKALPLTEMKPFPLELKPFPLTEMKPLPLTLTLVDPLAMDTSEFLLIPRMVVKSAFY